jgi:hypothetical protein
MTISQIYPRRWCLRALSRLSTGRWNADSCVYARPQAGPFACTLTSRTRRLRARLLSQRMWCSLWMLLLSLRPRAGCASRWWTAASAWRAVRVVQVARMRVPFCLLCEASDAFRRALRETGADIPSIHSSECLHHPRVRRHWPWHDGTFPSILRCRDEMHANAAAHSYF